MAKKLCSFFLIFAFVLGMHLSVFAAGGFTQSGGYTLGDPSYTLATEEAVLVYNKNVAYDIDYTDIYTGSILYVPIYRYEEESGNEAIATAKQIKEDKVEVGYKATRGAKYIKEVVIMDGKKDKVKDLPAGAYMRITFAEGYTGNSSADVWMNATLSVNKVSYAESRVELQIMLANRLEYIDDNAVYGAQVPTKFKVDDRYEGEVTFDMGNGIKYTGKVAKKAAYTIDFNQDPNYDMELMYPDAYMEFFNFSGERDSFENTGKLEIPINTKKFQDPETKTPRVYAYRVYDGQVLQALGSESASYDSRRQVLTIRTKDLNHYVLSNQKLKQTVAPENDDTFQSGYASDAEEASPANPGTGGDDISPNSAAMPGENAEQPLAQNQPQDNDIPSTGAKPVPKTGYTNEGAYVPPSASPEEIALMQGNIFAANVSNDNPYTAQQGPTAAPIILLGLCAGGFAAIARRR